MIETANPITRLTDSRRDKLEEQVQRIQSTFLDHVKRTRAKKLTADPAELGKIASAEVFIGEEAKRFG